MNRKDIMRMAREAGILVPGYREHIEHMERFAALVAAAEREACANVCDELADASNLVYAGTAAMKCAAAIRARGQA